VGGLGLALLSSMALTHWLGVSAYGEYAYIMAWVTILSIPSVGLGTLAVRETAMARSRDDTAAFGGFVRWSFVNTLWMSAALVLLGFFAVSIHATHLSPEPRPAHILGLALIPLACLQTLVGAVFRGCRRAELVVFLNEIVSPALMAIWAGGCLFVGFKASAAMALGGRLAALGLVLSAYALLLPRLNFRWRWQASTREQMAAWRKSLCSFALLRGINTTVERLPVLMLGFAIGPRPVALFSLASRIAETVVLTLWVVVMTVGPRLAELHARRNYREMQQLVTRSTMVISAWAVPVALGLILLGRWFLSWFGPHFAAGYPILVVLVIGQTVNATTGTVGLVLTMGGLERMVLKIHTYGLAMTAVLCLALIPVWGSVGAAIGSTAALVFWNIALAVQLYRRLGIVSCFYIPGFFHRRGAPSDSAALDNQKEIR
jgi:O-antigen/teichoic acid export membrane protein